MEAPLPAAKGTNGHKRKAEKIPDYLVREVVNGVKFYYPGFREAMKKTKTIDDIMPESTFQAILKNEVGDLLKSKIDRAKFRVLVGETGLHIKHGDNLGLDVAVFDKAVLTREKVNTHFADVPAELVVEVDVKVESELNDKELFTEYLVPKTKRLLGFGTKRVVWLLSKSRQTLVADSIERWQFLDWSEPVELMPGIILEIYPLLEAAELDPPPPIEI